MTIIARAICVMAIQAILLLHVSRIDYLKMPRLPPIQRAVRDRRSKFAINRHREFTLAVFHRFFGNTTSERKNDYDNKKTE